MDFGALLFKLLNLLFVGVIAVPPPPNWPELYKSCVNVETEREIIRAGWYVDTENRLMRLDSYGIPQGLNESTALLFQDALRQTEDFDYACQQFGPPLYIFIYNYAKGQMLSLFPAPDPPYRTCVISEIYKGNWYPVINSETNTYQLSFLAKSSIFNKFPNSPLLPDIEFVEQNHDNYTSYDHWRSEFFLFTMDYFFHTTNGLPYKLVANGEENLFLSFKVGELDEDTFQPPPGVKCKRPSQKL